MVIAVARSKYRSKLAEHLGAQTILNPNDHLLFQKIKAITNGEGVVSYMFYNETFSNIKFFTLKFTYKIMLKSCIYYFFDIHLNTVLKRVCGKSLKEYILTA